MTLIAEPDARFLRAQQRAVDQRIAEVDELQSLVDLVVARSESLPGMFRALNLVLAQITAVRKALVVEAQSVGHSNQEIAAMHRTCIEDFLARYPSS